MRQLLYCSFAISLGLYTTFASAQESVKTGDWPQWRGPQRNAICTETGLLREWPKGGPALLWDSAKVNAEPSVGAGFSSLAITQGKIFTMGSKGQSGFVYCLDAATGKEIWRSQVGGGEPRCTPTVDGERVYALTAQGKLVCLKIKDGAILWQKELVKDFGGSPPGFGGYAESPTIDGDKLIVTPGGKKARVVALNKLTGDTYWMCEAPANDGNGFASIVKTEVGGVKIYLTLGHSQLGLIGVDADTGKFLFSYKKTANGTANIPTVLVKDDYVFTSTGYGDGGSALLKLVPTGGGGIKVEEQYYFKSGKLQNHHGGMVMLGDYIYGGHGHNNGLPFCLEWKTGKLAWGPVRGAGDRSAAVLYADGHLYFRYESGEMALVEATPKGYELKSSFRPQIGGNGWPHAVIHNGRLFLCGANQILCYDIRQK